jgi:phenylacetate-coenzyme A ligase PaaK-like adenylate-forming protein
MHVFEDLFLLEVMDEKNRPVPVGTPGHKILVTNLFNRTLPLIRYEISDMVTLSPESCPCGRPFRLIQKIEGRNDDILYFPGKSAKLIPVHPIHFQSLLQAFPEMREYQIVQDENLLTFRLAVKIEGCERNQFEGKVREALGKKLASLEVACPAIAIEFVTQLRRGDVNMGKIKTVQSNVKKLV